MELEKELIQFFLQNHICTKEDILKAQKIQEKVNAKLGIILFNSGIISEHEYLLALSSLFDIPLLSENKEIEISAIQIEGIKNNYFEHVSIYPFHMNKTDIFIAISSSLNYEDILPIQQKSKKNIQLFLYNAEEEFILKNLYTTKEEELLYSSDDIEKLKELASEAPVIKMINNHFTEAVKSKASDIHYETDKDTMRVRLRIDGILQIIDTIPTIMRQATIARLKLLAKMNISENRLPQDGRISIKAHKQEVDIRVSSIPTAFGESFVLRLLGKQAISYSLESLHFFEDHLKTLRTITSKPHGVFLTTGPTGSGKTTTLYSILNELNSDEVKIISVEDPVEYQLNGINQIQVKSQIDFTFAKALRSILRQDPDIIMVGEIRDEETAKISIQSALTGHLVLSTLHTNSALGAITRLMDMGIEYFLLKSSINGLMAQRLVRSLCKECKIPYTLTPQEIKELHVNELLQQYHFINYHPHQAKGCKKCHFSGYSGRLSVAEIIPFTKEVQEIMQNNKNFNDLASLGYRTLYEDALLKFLNGDTSLEEVLKLQS